MFEDQDNSATPPVGNKPAASVPSHLPVAEPEDVLATVDPAKGNPVKRSFTPEQSAGIPEEYLQTGSGTMKRVLMIVLTLVLLGGIVGAAYWFFIVRQPSEPAPVMNPTTDTTPSAAVREDNPKDFNEDSDADGLSVENEDTAGTDVNNPDTDGDGLFDGEEVRIYGTNPLSVDTDADTFNDADEVRNGFNPKGEGRLFNVPQQ